MAVRPMAGPWCQRWRGGRPSYRDARSDVQVRRGRYLVTPISEKVSRRYVLAHHYSGSMPAARLHYGMIDGEDGHLCGVCVLGVPMQSKVLSLALPTLDPMWESLELSRFVVGDEVPANGESHFLGQVFVQAAQAGIRGLVSFADPMERRNAEGAVVKPGHLGIIYQATNAVYTGRATPRTLLMLPNGQVLSERAVSKIRREDRGKDYAVALLVDAGARRPQEGERLARWLPEALETARVRRVRHRGNHRYVFVLGGRAARRRAVVGIERAPYPKA